MDGDLQIRLKCRSIVSAWRRQRCRLRGAPAKRGTVQACVTLFYRVYRALATHQMCRSTAGLLFAGSQSRGHDEGAAEHRFVRHVPSSASSKSACNMNGARQAGVKALSRVIAGWARRHYQLQQWPTMLSYAGATCIADGAGGFATLLVAVLRLLRLVVRVLAYSSAPAATVRMGILPSIRRIFLRNQSPGLYHRRWKRRMTVQQASLFSSCLTKDSIMNLLASSVRRRRFRAPAGTAVVHHWHGADQQWASQITSM